MLAAIRRRLDVQADRERVACSERADRTTSRCSAAGNDARERRRDCGLRHSQTSREHTAHGRDRLGDLITHACERPRVLFEIRAVDVLDLRTLIGGLPSRLLRHPIRTDRRSASLNRACELSERLTPASLETRGEPVTALRR